MAHGIRTALITLSAAVVALAAVPPASATSASGTDSRSVSSRVFAASSPYYRKLPADTPTASDSRTLVASLNQQAHDFYGTEDVANITVNTHQYSPAMYVAYNTDPVYNITGWNCQQKYNGWDTEFNRIMRGVHLPADMQPDPSSDGAVTVYNPDSNEVIDLWQARKVNGQWQACWGGRMTGADQSIGAFEYGYGASASGLSLWGGTIRAQELLDGHIDHAISLGIPRTKWNSISWPANRSDGGTKGTQLSIGQMLRLPADLDIDSMKMSPLATTIAKAAQEYGIIITDTSGAVSFSAENPIGLRTNPYATIFRGRWPSQEMAASIGRGEAAFPLDKLVALPMNYGAPDSSTAGEGSGAGDPSDQVTPPTTIDATDYASGVKQANPFLYWRLDDKKKTAADASGNGKTGTLKGVTKSVWGAIAGNRAISTKGKSSSVVYKSTLTQPSEAFSVQVWFRTTSKKGGKIFGFENKKTGTSKRYDRSLYLTSDGRLVFGTYYGSLAHVASPGRYNDGSWHMATATQGRDGTRLYVDGALVASNSATRAESGLGYWRLGGGNLKHWPAKPRSSYYSGRIDEFAVFNSVLSPATIAALYALAK